MPLELSLRSPTSIPLEVDALRVETVRRQSHDEIRATPVQYGNRRLPLADFFDVAGSAEDGEVVWIGDCTKVKLIGTGMTEGRMTVRGPAGMHVGAEMRGGEIVVEGDAGDWVGAEMHGGRIRVLGNAGHLVGSVYRGGRKGMTGGEILIHGNAGNEIGHTLRRGLIAVGGRSGDAPGFNMLAGTILLCGEPGIRLGAGMKRGTIGLLGGGPAPLMLPTFRRACVDQPVFLRVYLKHLRQLGFPLPADCESARYERFHGDFLELGRGEILARVAS